MSTEEAKPAHKHIGYYNPNVFPVSFQTSKGRTVEVQGGQPVLSDGFLAPYNADLETQVREGILSRILPENPNFKRWNARIKKQAETHVVHNGPTAERSGQKSSNAVPEAPPAKPPESFVSSKGGVMQLPEGATLEGDQIVFRGMKFVSPEAVTRYAEDCRKKETLATS